MQIEYRHPDDLKPYEKNPRTHSQSQVKKIVASIREFGFNNPILIDGDNGIIAGHGRLEAARIMGLEKVPVLELSHLSDDQKRAYVIADNKLALEAGWDDELLFEELKALEDAGLDPTLTGFDKAELDELRAMFEDSEKKDGRLLSVMNVAIADPTQKVERGEVWKIGPHVMVVASVFEDWQKWIGLLDASKKTLFCPFPNPLVPLSDASAEFFLVMVQPDEYVAGHLIDKYRAVHGEESCEKVPA